MEENENKQLAANQYSSEIISQEEADRESYHKQLCDKIHEVYCQKNRAYGNSFGETFEKLGIISAVTRISDKYNRLVNLAKNPDINKGDEAIEDTLLDMANYALMTYMEIQNGKKRTNK